VTDTGPLLQAMHEALEHYDAAHRLKVHWLDGLATRGLDDAGARTYYQLCVEEETARAGWVQASAGYVAALAGAQLR
jgi:hypothetical protein